MLLIFITTRAIAISSVVVLNAQKNYFFMNLLPYYHILLEMPLYKAFTAWW